MCMVLSFDLGMSLLNYILFMVADSESLHQSKILTLESLFEPLYSIFHLFTTILIDQTNVFIWFPEENNIAFNQHRYVMLAVVDIQDYCNLNERLRSCH